MDLSSEKPTLKALREKAGLTQLDVAKEIGVDPKTIRDYERRGAKPSFERAILLAEVYGCTLYELAAAFGLLRENAGS